MGSLEKETKLGGRLEIIIDAIGEIIAYLAIFMILFMYVNGVFDFLPDSTTVLLTYIREIVIIGVVALKGFEFALKRGFFATIFFGAVVLAVVVFMFFPESLPSFLS